jgi:parallel beta-helix repeat protein
MKWIIGWAFTLLIYFSAQANTYYLSATGNDNHDGKTIACAWASLDKLNRSMHFIVTGDSILFERGSIFKGELKVVTSDLYVGAYGTGNKPIISGAIEINKWFLVKPNLWMSECIACPITIGNVFIDGVVQQQGRYPNTSYLTITSASRATSTLSDITLGFANDYWNNAEVVVKSSRWTLDNLTVKTYRNKVFKTAMQPSYPLTVGAGYFIQNHLATLDKQGEWFFNSTTKQLFIYLESTDKPEKHIIQVSILPVGLTVNNLKNIVVENLAFHKQSLQGAVATNCSHLQLNQLDVIHAGKNGMEIVMNADVCVENCLIADSGNNGVEWSGNKHGIFTNNTILRTGLVPGRGNSGNGTYIGFRMYASEQATDQNLIALNTIDSSGYSGLDFRSGNTIIRNNLISNFCLVKDDGAGIYTWNNTLGSNIISANIIQNGIGSGEGTTEYDKRFAYGIYIDDRSSSITVKDNIVSACATAGIFIHNSKLLSITGNTAFGNGTNIANKERGQFYIKLDTLGKLGRNIKLQLIVSSNKWIANHEALNCVYLSVLKIQNLDELGSFTGNSFEVVNPNFAVAALFSANAICSASVDYRLKDWQALTLYEQKSVLKLIRGKGKTSKNEKNMILNGSMSSNSNGWYVWPEKSVLVHQKINFLANPLLKVIIPPENSEVLLYHEGISFVKGKLYRLSFSAKSSTKTKVEFTPLMEKSPWQALGEYMCFSVDTHMQSFTYYFRPSISHKKARVNFKSDATFWLDTVILYEVDEIQ